MSFFDTLSALIVKDSIDAISKAKREAEKEQQQRGAEERRERIRTLALMEKCLEQHNKIHDILFQICLNVLSIDHQQVLSNYAYFIKALIAFPYYRVLETQGFIDVNQKKLLGMLKESECSYSGIQIREAVDNPDNANFCHIAMQIFVNCENGVIASFWEYIFDNCNGSEKQKSLIKNLIKTEITMMDSFYQLAKNNLIYDDSHGFIREIEKTLYEELEYRSGDDNPTTEIIMSSAFKVAKQFEEKYKAPLSYKVIVQNWVDYTYSKGREIAENNLVKYSGITREYAKTIFDHPDGVIKDGLSSESAKELIDKLSEVNIVAECVYSWKAVDEKFNVYANENHYINNVNKAKITTSKKIKKYSLYALLVFLIVEVIFGVKNTTICAIAAVCSLVAMVTHICAINGLNRALIPKGEKRPAIKTAKGVIGFIASFVVWLSIMFFCTDVKIAALSLLLASFIWWGIFLILHIVDKIQSKKK